MSAEYRAEQRDDGWMIVGADGWAVLCKAIQCSDKDAAAIAHGMNNAFRAGKRRRSDEINALLRGDHDR
jgi:hypothetical protein